MVMGATPGVAAGASLRQALHSRSFWWLYLATVTAAPSMFIPFAHASAAARDLGIDEARAVGLVGMIGMGSVIGRFVIGGLADRIGRILTLVLLQVSMGASLMLWSLSTGYTGLALFALWFGLSYGGIVSVLPAICMDIFGARAVSAIIGTLYTGAALGNLLGPVVAGAVFDASRHYGPVIWGCLVLSAVATLAWLSARTTVYTLTDQRLVLRIGIVLTLTFNLPLTRIETAGLRLDGAGCGDMPLSLRGDDRIAWLHLWPHARPWRLTKPEPMLRCVPDAVAVAAKLTDAWGVANQTPTAFVAQRAQSSHPTPAWQPVSV